MPRRPPSNRASATPRPRPPLRRAALAHAHEAGQGRWLRSRRGAIPGRLATAAGILAVAIAAVLIWHTQRSDVYRTPAGERRVVTLSDGSQIALDSQSEVRVRYTARARALTLAKGQARFDVSHDVERPFSVAADGHNSRLLSGDPVVAPRMTNVPVRLPLPPAKRQGSIYETQSAAKKSYFTRAA